MVYSTYSMEGLHGVHTYYFNVHSIEFQKKYLN